MAEPDLVHRGKRGCQPCLSISAVSAAHVQKPCTFTFICTLPSCEAWQMCKIWSERGVTLVCSKVWGYQRG